MTPKAYSVCYKCQKESVVGTPVASYTFLDKGKEKNRDTIFLNGEAYKCDNLDILFCLSFDQV